MRWAASQRYKLILKSRTKKSWLKFDFSFLDRNRNQQVSCVAGSTRWRSCLVQNELHQCLHQISVSTLTFKLLQMLFSFQFLSFVKVILTRVHHSYVLLQQPSIDFEMKHLTHMRHWHQLASDLTNDYLSLKLFQDKWPWIVMNNPIMKVFKISHFCHVFLMIENSLWNIDDFLHDDPYTWAMWHESTSARNQARHFVTDIP